MATISSSRLVRILYDHVWPTEVYADDDVLPIAIKVLELDEG